MKVFISILSQIEIQGIHYSLSAEEGQVRIGFDQIPFYYIVVTEDQKVHANNVQNLREDQIKALIENAAYLQHEVYHGDA